MKQFSGYESNVPSLSACLLALKKRGRHLFRMRLPFIISAVLCHSLVAALVPAPRQIEAGSGQLIVDVQTSVIAPKNLASHAEVLIKALQKTTGYLHRSRTLAQIGRMQIKRAIRLGLATSEKEEFYRLEITPEGATITGSDPAGLMHGVQTFVQLLPVAKEPFPRALIPAQTIDDWAETRRRIFHLDISAHLFPSDDLKTLIGWLSFHKINELHLQLNGDHGWRMESLKFPRLHEIGSVRSSTPPFGDPTGSDSSEYGGYYTQENLKALVAYAASRQIELVPAFTFVSGASALIAAYPELGKEAVPVAATWEKRAIGVRQNEKTLQFLDDLFGEVAAIFPSKSVRVEGNDDSFHKQLGALLAKRKKELFESHSIPTTNFSNYSRPKDAELFLSPKLEAEDGFNPVNKVYRLQSTTTAQASLRTQYVPDFPKLQHQVFPRLAAFAEASWRPAGRLNYEDFRTRLNELADRYSLMGINAAKAYNPPAGPLVGTKVTGSIAARDLHQADCIFDGNKDSFFWSAEGLKKGDHLTLEFPYPVTGDVTFATGRSGDAGGEVSGILVDGVLDLSPDGEEWDAPTEFFDGLASVTVPEGTRFIRLRATAPQDGPLALHEVTLSEAILMPIHGETRDLQLPVTKEEIQLTFKANFVEFPELRDEITMIRRTFFGEWLQLSTRLGLAHDPKTPRNFEVKPGEPGTLTPNQARLWLIKRLVPRIQNYPITAPLWFVTGISSRLYGEVPAKPDRKKNLAGGPETAAFLNWIAKKHGEEILIAISQDCRSERYRLSVWKTFTKSSLEELSAQYQDEK